MTLYDIIKDWGAPGGFLTLLGGIVVYFVRDRRKGRAEARLTETEADEAEIDLTSKRKTSSVVSIEAEMVAMAHSFEIAQGFKDGEITFLKGQLAEERERSSQKDAKVRELEAMVASLQAQATELQRKLSDVLNELTNLHTREE